MCDLHLHDRFKSFKILNSEKKLILISIPIILELTGTNMDNGKKQTWFEGSNNLRTDLPKVKVSIEDICLYYADVISLVPGMTDVKLIEEGEGFVTIQTNEGIMIRTRF